ncbi:hypothetical protein Z042_26010 [Chania multitudinisentens RB-25]|uniref:Phage tail fibre protein N-terminal domain-containing protein n=1 Tax=Chania multitudinisentens RB-25 TaxID=1441930 RepID=A0A0D4ZXS4_9GAMM|nr:phage tail protein [Chania multitudinisentens]AJW28929.1 hypothetical protein Z042_26010 [Chania multitudinisentens RB-25]
MREYFSILTKAGEAAFAAASVTGVAVRFAQMAIGDGGGTATSPNADQTGLINELYRAPLNRLVIADQSANVIRAEMIIPPQNGGFWMREAALLDEDGTCLVVASMPASYKPLLEEGAGRSSAINLMIGVSSTRDVQLKADPSVIVATISEVNQAKNEAKDYTDEQLGAHERSRTHPDATLNERGFTRLNNAVDSDNEATAATPKAVKAAYDLAASKAAFDTIYPPGIAIFFAVNLDPNEQWPGTRWQYTGENKTIRLAKANGSNVGATGGSDTVQISRDNLPAVQIAVSGTASSVDLGIKETVEDGAASVRVYRFGEAGRENQVGRFSIDNVSMGDIPIDVNIPPHKHSINLGPHQHPVSGNTATLGTGEAISIVNSHVLLMCWYRTA